MGGKELASALVKMATSPVKADREAVARIERECEMDIIRITTSLENSELMSQSILSSPSVPTNIKIFATGMFWAAVIGTAAMFVRPNYTVCGLCLGFVAGVSGRIVWSDE